MNSINANINNKYNLRPPFKAGEAHNAVQNQKEEVQIPDLYYVPENEAEQTTFKERLKKADVMELVYPWVAHPILMAGTCAGLAYGVDKFSQACGGDYEKSLLGKAARLGDRIENSSIAKSEAAKKVFNLGATAKNKFNELTKNSDVINAIRTTPSKAEWSMVLDELLSQEQRIVREFTEITDGLHLGVEASSDGMLGAVGMGDSGSGRVKLKNLALTKEEKNLVKNIANQEEAVNTVLLKRLGRSDAEIQRIIGLGEGSTQAVKDEILKEMGLTAEKLELIKKDKTGQYIKDVKAAAEKVKGKVWIGAGNYSFLGPIQPFERRIGCDEVYNRLHSMSEGATTRTGKLMSKFLQRCHRGFTFGGGKLGVLMFVAPHLVRTMIDTKKADPDQKAGTVANGIIGAMSWVFTFPLGLKIMHSLCGAQYAGMSKEQVQEYRNKLSDFNKLVESDHFETKIDYDKAKEKLVDELKELKKPAKPQNLLTKMCKKVGSFLTMDLEQIKSYRNGTFGGNTARKLPSFFKNLGGVPMRLILWGCITMGVLDAVITKGTKAIFGNFYDRTKEEEHEENKKKQKQFLREDLRTRMLEAQKRKLEAANAPQVQEELIQEKLPETAENEKETVQEAKENNVETPAPEIVTNNVPVQEKPAEKQIPQNKYIPNQNVNPEILNQKPKTEKRDNYTYIPSQNSVLGGNPTTQQSKYIPSQAEANIVKNFDNSGLEGALRRADRAEAKALQVLSGNFNQI